MIDQSEIAVDLDPPRVNQRLSVRGLTRRPLIGEGVFGTATAPAGQMIFYCEDHDMMDRSTGAAQEATLYPSMITVRMTPQEAHDLVEPLLDHDKRLIPSNEIYLIQLAARIVGPGSSLDIHRNVVIIGLNIAMAFIYAMQDAHKDGPLEATLKSMMGLILTSDDRTIKVPFSSFNEILAALNIVGRLPERD